MYQWECRSHSSQSKSVGNVWIYIYNQSTSTVLLKINLDISLCRACKNNYERMITKRKCQNMFTIVYCALNNLCVCIVYGMKVHYIEKLCTEFLFGEYIHTYTFHWSNICPSTGEYETCQEMQVAGRNPVKKHIDWEYINNTCCRDNKAKNKM
jgi:hypothetical protein